MHSKPHQLADYLLPANGLASSSANFHLDRYDGSQFQLTASQSTIKLIVDERCCHSVTKNYSFKNQSKGSCQFWQCFCCFTLRSSQSSSIRDKYSCETCGHEHGMSWGTTNQFNIFWFSIGKPVRASSRTHCWKWVSTESQWCTSQQPMKSSPVFKPMFGIVNSVGVWHPPTSQLKTPW